MVRFSKGPGLLLLLLLTLHSELKPLQCTAVGAVSENDDSLSYEFYADYTSRYVDDEQKPEAAESRPLSQTVSQRSFLRFQLDRKRGQEDDSVDHWATAKEAEVSRGAATRRLNLQEVELDEKTKLPKQQLLDKVEKLPGQPEAVEFGQYAGYVTVNESAGRALFYYFVEATSDPDKKPLLLWLNGGPGCSSLGYGAFEELGPFHLNKDGETLYRNPYSWNKLANIIFLESPAGVGFSYSNTSSDYSSNGDNRTASDSLIFLLNWFERFPQYKHREFFITGESYGGNYVPQLTQRLHHHNQKLEDKVINLKGFMVGNAIINSDTDDRGMVDFWWTHALISDETYSQLVPCLSNNQSCTNLVNAAYNEQGNIDPYDIYTQVCLTLNTSSLRAFRGPGQFGRLRGYDPCEDNYVTNYLNTPEVQKALHANVTKVAFSWQPCSNIVGAKWQDSAPTVIPIYKELIAAGFKIWVYSGDVDSVVPVTSTKYSLGLLKLNTTVPWYAWYRSKQVGGYTQGYAGLTFVTVRDSGHEVPMFQPARALSLAKAYVTGVPLPAS